MFSEVNPIEKRLIVERFQNQGENVLFIGDGVNDGPVLAQANVGIAINSSSDITAEAASIVLLNDNLYDLMEALKICITAFRRVKYNFGWAFVYNVTLIPLAMGAFYPLGVRVRPMFAGIAMALSDVSVIISSLMMRLLYKGISRDFQDESKDELGQESVSKPSGFIERSVSASKKSGRQ